MAEPESTAVPYVIDAEQRTARPINDIPLDASDARTYRVATYLARQFDRRMAVPMSRDWYTLRAAELLMIARQCPACGFHHGHEVAQCPNKQELIGQLLQNVPSSFPLTAECDHEYCTCESECEHCRKCGKYLGQ